MKAAPSQTGLLRQAEEGAAEEEVPVAKAPRGRRLLCGLGLSLALLGSLALVAFFAPGFDLPGFRNLRRPTLRAAVEAAVQEFSMPEGAGVNLGGWFVLEDWFFSGSKGSLVSSEKTGQGLCLPPLLHHVDEPWPSEGVFGLLSSSHFI